MSLEKTKGQLIELLGNRDNRVIALSGKWGTGKTHLWEQVKAESQNERIRNALYVSLFGLSSIDQVKRKLMEGVLPDSVVKGGKWDAIKSTFSAGINALASHYKALAALNDLNLLLMAPFVLRDKAIVIDDIERKHVRLGIDEILGFVDEYSKQFDVRFILILNDDQLPTEQEQRTLWLKFREKLIDREIKLCTTPDEAFSIAITLFASPLYGATLKKAVVSCGLNNIRIVSKVIQLANQILAGRALDDAIQARVVPSIVLFAAIHYCGLDEGPDFQFALNIGNPDYSNFLPNAKDAKTDEDKREDRWRILMSGLGISSCDEFEMLLVEFLESGLFETHKINAIIDRYGNEQHSMQISQRANDLIKRAISDPRATDESLLDEAANFLAFAGQLNPY